MTPAHDLVERWRHLFDEVLFDEPRRVARRGGLQAVLEAASDDYIQDVLGHTGEKSYADANIRICIKRVLYRRGVAEIRDARKHLASNPNFGAFA